MVEESKEERSTPDFALSANRVELTIFFLLALIVALLLLVTMTTATERGEEAASLIDRIILEPSTISFDAALDAFRPGSSSQARASIILQISQTKEDVTQIFSSRSSKLLASEDADSLEFFATIRLLTSLFAIAPQAAHEITFESQCIRQILGKSALAADHSYLPAFITAELLCAAANHPASRKWILSDCTDSSKTTQKIVEIDKDTTEHTTMHWLLSFAEKANLENASSRSLLSKVALLSSLALHKIQRGSKGKEEDQLSNGQTEEEDEEEEERRHQEDALLFELAKAHLIADEKSDGKFFSESSLSYTLDNSNKEEMERACRLSSVESLTYLTLDTFYRDAVANAEQLVVRLCRYAKVTDASDNGASRTLFPMRGSTSAQPSSTYELDKVLTSTGLAKWNGQDTALQYGLSTLLSHIMAYPPLLTNEEKQMEKLKRMANAKAKVKGADKVEEKSDLRMTTVAIEARIEKVLDAGGAEALAAIALGGAKESRINSSPAIRETVSKALLSMTTRQSKLQRGKIIQQGGAKALLTLSTQHIADALQGKTTQGNPSFAAMQGLAHLLITENPNLVLRDTAEAIPCLLYLYCHSSSSRLQRFEAALALTNLASLGEVMAKGIASCAFPRKILGSTDFAGAGVSEIKEGKVKIIDVLDERIFLEDNEMSRRSSLELLCNLLVEDSIFQRWSGEQEDIVEAERGDITQGKTMKNLIFLIALCAPLGVDQATNEGGLKLRLAASGAVATLCSSPSTCERLLATEPRILRKISRLVGGSGVEAEEDPDAVADAELHEQDIHEDLLGSDHASLQLALRGLTCLDCLVQYVAWLQSKGNADVTMHKSKLIEAGCVEAINSLALSMVKKTKQNHSNATVQSLQQQVAQQSFDSLRACKTLGLV
jgi:hypothetical protein